ncbi:MAG: biotin/lipoyl-binding protein [Sulfuritalea sp.]|nr:biotin/lipoyl-binding protein [Sulfuritalea sp.]
MNLRSSSRDRSLNTYVCFSWAPTNDPVLTPFDSQAALDLLRHYAAIFGQLWMIRRELDPPQRLSHEAAFLPAALELQETPVSPAPRIVAWLLMAFAVIAVLWASFGHIDVVAVAQGKIFSNAGSKLIQPIETATVKAIHVIDGQAVKAGQMLVELDATMARADSTRSANDLTAARLQSARARALLAALASGGAPRIEAPADLSAQASAPNASRKNSVLDGHGE